MERPKHNITITDTKFRPIPEGRYLVQLVHISEVEKGKFDQERFTFKVEIIQGPFKGAFCNDFINMDKDGKYGAGNKMGQIIKAMTGQCEPGQYFDVYSLLGCKCYAYIEILGGKKFVNKIRGWEQFNE